MAVHSKSTKTEKPTVRERGRSLVAEKRGYRVQTVKQAKEIASGFINELSLGEAVQFGLPEVDDRYHIWRVPLKAKGKRGKIGEIVIDAKSSLIQTKKTTSREVLESRLLGRDKAKAGRKSKTKPYQVSALRNTVACGPSEEVLEEFPAESVDLIFTSPPYYNARPEYTDYVSYEEYLLAIRKVI